MLHRNSTFDPNPRVVLQQAILQQREGVFQKRQQVGALKLVLFTPGVSQKISDDIVQALRFASHDFHQRALFRGEAGDFIQHLDRACNGRKRVADFVGYGRCETPDCGQTVLYADFAFQAANRRQIVKTVDVSNCPAIRHAEFGDNYAKRLPKTIARRFAHFTMSAAGTDVGQGIQE